MLYLSMESGIESAREEATVSGQREQVAASSTDTTETHDVPSGLSSTTVTVVELSVGCFYLSCNSCVNEITSSAPWRLLAVSNGAN